MILRAAFAVILALSIHAAPALAGPITAAPPSLNFGNLGVGAPAAKLSVTLTNTGNQVAAVTNVTIGGANPGDFTATPALQPPLNLGPGATLAVDVTFAPAAGGTRAGTLTVTVGGGLGNTDVLLSGVGLGPKIAVTPSPINGGGTKINVPTNTKFTVANSGGGTVSVKSLVVSGPDAALFTVGGVPNLPSNLGAGQSFAPTLTFSPVAAGARTATLTVTSDDPNTPSLAVPLKASAGDPAIATDAGTMAFGNIRAGLTSPTQTITVSNTGLSDLHVTQVTIDAGPMGNGNPGDFLLTPVMPATVAPGGTLPVKLAFKPSAVGQRSARVAIASDDANAPTKYVTLLGNGTFAMLSIAPQMIDFGTQTVLAASKPQPVTISNAGDAAANVVGITFAGMAGTWFRTSGIVNPPVTVPAMGKVTIDLVTLPLALGPGVATVTLTTDDPKTPSFALPLAVTAIGGATAIDPAYVEFGMVPVLAKKTQSVTITNNGTGALGISAFDLMGANAMDNTFTIGNAPMPLPVSLPAGQKLTFDITCTPMVMGIASAEIDIQLDGDPKVRSLHLPIDCVGATAGMSLMPLSLNFPTQLVGSASAPQLVTLSNTGGTTISVATVALSGANANQFVFDDPGKFDVAPGRNKTIPISCAPVGAGTFSASLVVTAAGFPVSQVKLACTAVAATLMVGAGQGTIDFGDVSLGTGSDPREISLKAGAVGLAITSVTASDPAFIVDDSALKRTLAPMGTTSFKVLFAPSVAGSRSGTIAVAVNGAKTPAVTISVKGNGLGTKVMTSTKDSGCTVGGRGARSSSAPLLLLGLALVGLALRRPRARGLVDAS